MDEQPKLAVVGLERSVELRTKELVMVLREVERFHANGEKVPQLENRIKELKDVIRDMVDEDEVDPRSEWTIKARELLA